MAYFPLFVELEGCPCLVIGGGEVAYRKVKALASCGARVTVVSPQLTAGLRRLVQRKKVRWRPRRFRAGDLDGAQLVVAATDDQPVNEIASRLAKRRRLLINVVDQPKLCSFIFPSVVRRGKLALAISTGGVSPALAKWIRKDLETRYGPEFGRLLEGMRKVRSEVLRRTAGVGRRKRLFEKALEAYFKALKIE